MKKVRRQVKKSHLHQAEITKGLRQYLYFTAAISGAVILILEILGAKMLSPFFGTSHFVWTAQIAVTLISLAAGYYFGGWLVDRSSKLKRLYTCLLLAGLYLCLALSILRPMAYFFLEFRLALGSMMASLFLFFVPLTLLSVTGPFVIRVLTQSTHTLGRQVGLLSAVSTIGSVIGTLIIGYVLIPFVPNSITMIICAGIIFIIVFLYFAIWNRNFSISKNSQTSQTSKNITQAIFIIIIAIVSSWIGARSDSISGKKGMKELARLNSHFGMMQVLESEKGHRFYLNDLLLQNGYDPQTKKSLTVFTYMLADLVDAYVGEIDSLLVIGLGVGIVPMHFAERGSEVDVVEINPRISFLGEEFFDFDPSKVRVHLGDGRHYLGTNDASYDAILLDAFLGDSSPSHLMTRESFQAIRARLRPKGVLVINCFGSFRRGDDFFVSSLSKTLKSVFSHLKIHDGGEGNVFFVASDLPLKTPHQYDSQHVHPLIRSRVERAFHNIAETSIDRGMILRDDYNPVEFYDAAIREGFRKDLAIGMKSSF